MYWTFLSKDGSQPKGLTYSIRPGYLATPPIDDGRDLTKTSQEKVKPESESESESDDSDSDEEEEEDTPEAIQKALHDSGTLTVQDLTLTLTLHPNPNADHNTEPVQDIIDSDDLETLAATRVMSPVGSHPEEGEDPDGNAKDPLNGLKVKTLTLI